ncbi:MAG: cupin domain-containing protein [Terracidiphilus sp.]
MTLRTQATASTPHANPAKHVPTGTGTAYWGPGGLMTFLITSKESGGAIFVSEISVAPGRGTVPHIHRQEDESFRLLEGTLTMQVGGNTITASAGDFILLPRGIAHSFKNTGDREAKALVIITPGGLEGYFAEVFEPATNHSAVPPSDTKEMMDRARAVAPRYGLELLPPA